MPKNHTVQTGETLLSIAHVEGFRSWETLWNHPENETLRSQRTDPDDLYIGDNVFIPDKAQKSVTITAVTAVQSPSEPDAELGSEENVGEPDYTFVAKTLKSYLSLSLEDDSGQPYKNKPYQIDVTLPDGSQSIDGTTDADGRLNTTLHPEARSLDIMLWPESDTSAEPVTWSFQLGATDEPAADS